MVGSLGAVFLGVAVGRGDVRRFFRGRVTLFFDLGVGDTGVSKDI